MLVPLKSLARLFLKSAFFWAICVLGLLSLVVWVAIGSMRSPVEQSDSADSATAVATRMGNGQENRRRLRESDDEEPAQNSQAEEAAPDDRLPDESSLEVAPLDQYVLVEELLDQVPPHQERLDVAVRGSGTTYYVDCTAGDDANRGITQEDAWATVEKVNTVMLLPGDRLRFKRGCSWNGPLDASWHGSANQPIVISSYGTGALPIIQDSLSTNVRIRGSYLIIENLHATLSSPPNPDPNCNNQPLGWRAGFAFQDGAAYNIVQGSLATNLAIGVFFNSDTHHNKAKNNTLINNNVVWELNEFGTLGAMGVLLQGDQQEVGHNYFAGNMTICTYTGVVESNSVELYAATNSTIHHNVAYGDRVFSEMGSSPTTRSENNTYAYNLHVSSMSHPTFGARFVVTRGWEHQHGPVLGTKVYNNTIYLTGSGSKGVACEQCDTNILSLENNILWVNREPFSSDGPFVERNNIYWSGGGSTLLNFYGVAMSKSSQTVDPLFVDAANNDFRLQMDSPAINLGAMLSLNVFDYDLGHTMSPVGGARDIGAFEYRRQPWQQVFGVPGRIEAEDYRRGGAGVGFFDTTAGNSGKVYRADDVDIEVTQDTGGDYDVGWIAQDEWLAYEINAAATGIYRMVVRVATPAGDRRFRIEIDDIDASGSVLIPWTGDWQKWVDVPVLLPIKAGRHTMRLVAETARFNVNYMAFSKLQ